MHACLQKPVLDDTMNGPQVCVTDGTWSVQQRESQMELYLIDWTDCASSLSHCPCFPSVIQHAVLGYFSVQILV